MSKVPEWVSRIDQEDPQRTAGWQDGYKDFGCNHASKPEKTRMLASKRNGKRGVELTARA